jgi:CubicO group peptidase (beta-lactamase class C family)
VVLVARRGKIAYFDSFGMQDAKAGIPMQKDSIFRIYSMTKPLVSVAAMMLHEEGRFFLSDPVGEYFPEYEEMTVAKEGRRFSTVQAQNVMTIQDLLRE